MIRVRFAPSPTGYLHIGGARTALYAHLFARKNKGRFVIRVEDTDQERSTDEFLRLQLADLDWLGYEWDEGLRKDTLESFGPLGPYRQSQRLSIYQEYASELIKMGKAFYCFMTEGEIEQARNESMKSTGQPKIKSPYRDWVLDDAKSKISEGARPVVRFKNPDGAQ